MIRSILRFTWLILFFVTSSVNVYAAAPNVTTVSVPPGNYKIGSVIVFTIVADGTGYTVDAGTTINGVDVTSTFATAGGNNYTLTYTVASGNTDRASVGAIPINILIRSGAGAGNLNTYTSSAVSAGVTIDANAPTISNVAIPNVAMKVGDVVTATITVGDDGGQTYTLSSGSIGGFTLSGLSRTNNTTYTAQFTITNGGVDVPAASNIPVSLILLDPATNPSTTYNTAIAQGGDAIDANGPVITNVTIPNTAMKVGSVVTATITVANDGGEVYTLSAGTIGGFTLGSLSRTNSTTYTAQFTVTNGGVDVAAGSSIPVSLVLLDPAGSISATYATAIAQGGDPIDANVPTISNVTIPNTAKKVGSVVIATITVGNDGGQTYTLSSGTIGGFTLGSLSRTNSTTYTAQFTVSNGGTDVPAGSDIPVSLIMADPATNPSATYSTAISQGGDPIDANLPTVSSVTIPDVAMKVNDVVTATITVGDDGGLTYTLSSGTIGGFTLGSFSRTNNTTYTAQFTITNGGTNVAAGSNIPVNLIIADPATNPSAAYTTAISQATDPIDANNPAIQIVGPLVTTGGTVVANFWNATNTGINITVPLSNSDASLDNGSIQLQSNVNGGGFSNVGAAVIITNGERVAGQRVFSLTAAQFEAISNTDTDQVRFRAIVNDNVGNTSTFTQSAAITLDQTPPAALVAAPDLTSATDTEGLAGTGTGTNSDNITKSNNPTFTGSGVNSTTVKIFSGATEIGSGAVSGSAYSIGVGAIAEGVHVITGRVMDAAGNLSTAATPYNVTIDRTAPQIVVKRWNADGVEGNREEVIITFTELLDMSDGLNIANSDGDATKHGFSSSVGGVKDGDSKFFSSFTVSPTTYNNVIVLRSLNNGDWPSSAVQITYKDFATNPTAANGNNPNYVYDLAGNELVTTSFTPSDTDPPALASGFVLNPNDNNPETIVFQVNETLSQGASVTGFSVDGLPVIGTYDLASTITLTSSLNGLWNNSTVVSYTPGNVKDGTNNFMVAIPNTPIRLQNITIASNNANGFTSRAKLGDVITVNFLSAIAPSVTPTVIIDNDNATPAGVTGVHPNWQATYTITGANNDGPLDMLVYMLTAADSTGTISTTLPLPVASTVDVDKTAPIITPASIVSNNTNPAYAKPGDVVTLSFSVNETLFNTPSVTIGGTAVNPVNITNVGFNYTATAIMNNTYTEGVLTFSITVMDVVGNTTLRTTTTDASAITFDKTNPTVTSIVVNNSIINSYAASINGTTPTLNGNQIDYTINFSEPVSNVTFTTLDEVDSGPSPGYPRVNTNQLSVSPVTAGGAPSTSPSQYWKVIYNNVSGTGTYRLDLVNNLTVRDRASLALSVPGGTFVGPSYTVSMPQPANPVSALSTNSVNSNDITVNWTDVGTASHYLVILTTAGSAPAVTDGTYVINDSNFGDGTVAQNIVQGVQNATFTGLTANTAYNVFIYPYALSPNTIAVNNTAIDFNATTPPVLSRGSDIIRDGTFTYSPNIEYTNFQTTDIPTGTGANSVVLERFVLRDGAGSSDSDGFGTTLTSITFDVVNYQNLRKLALYDGTTEIQELSVTTPTITVINATTARITFSLPSLSTAADNGNKTLSLRASFNSTGVIDNQIISFTLVSAIASGTSSSQLKTNTPVGIQSNLPSGTNDINNKIEVVATQIDFTTVPASASISVPFAVQVSARDLFANLDVDYNGTITATETNPSSDLLFHTLNIPSGAFVNGQLTYPANFQFDIGDGNVQLTINSGAGSGANNVNAGAIAGTSPTISVISSYESLIVSSDFYNGTSRDINYINYQDANITSSANGYELDFLYLFDGGYDRADADGAPTILDDLTLGISNPQSIKKIAVYEKDLDTNVITEILELDNSNINVTNGYGQITFSNLNISSADDYYKGILILATFNSSTTTIQDRDTIQVSVLAATLNAGSKFAPDAVQTNTIAGEPKNNVTFPLAAAAIQRGTFGPYNKLQVIATSLDFVTQPYIFAGINEPIDGSPGASPFGSTGIVHARDKFAVIDTDFTGAASATTVSADANPFGYPTSFTNGILNLASMQYANAGDGTLIVKAGILNSSVPGVGDIGNSIACSTVDVIHVTAQNDITNGVEASESLKGGTTSKRIFGLDFFAEHATGSEPSLTGFSIIFRDDVGGPYPYTSASGTVYKNFKLWRAEGNGSPVALAEGVDYTLDPLETQTAALISSGAPSTSKDKLAFILTDPVTLYQSNYKFYLNVDVDVNVSVGTPPITPYLVDLGYGFVNTNNNIKTTIGSSTAQVQGITRKFASVKPPVLVYTSPSNGQLNVDPALNVIKLKFDVPVVTFDGILKVYNRDTGALSAIFTASNGLSDGSNLKAAAVDTLEFVAPVGFDFEKDVVYYVTIEKGVFSNIDINQRRGISDEGFNLFGGIEYNGTFYFKGSSPNPPELVGTDATKYYYSPTSATFNFQFNQTGKVHYMVVHPTSLGVAPLKVTNAQILGTAPYTNSTIIARGTTVIDQHAPNLQYVTINASLTNNIDYYVYAFAENDANPIPIPTSAPFGSSTNAFAVDADGPTLKIKKTNATTNLVNNPRFEVCSNSSVKMEEPIIISEPLGNPGDFATGFGLTDIQSFNILLPTGFQFDVTKTPTINFNGADFKPLPKDKKSPEDTVSASFINTTILRVSFINNGSTSFDNIIISNLYIIASSSDINGNIIRFSGNGLTTISDGRVLARITSGSSAAIMFTNSYHEEAFAFDPPLSPLYPQITKTVTYIPDNFATSVRLIPEPPLGDYGASFFSGSGLTNDILTLAAVTKDAAFNITLTHTDQNGCNSTTVEQYLVYDHTKTIPELLKTTVTGYNISGIKVGLKPGPVNSDNVLGTSDDYVPGSPTPTLNQADSVSYVGLAGYQLIDLYADIPVRTTGSGQVLELGSAWDGLVKNIPRLAVIDKNNNGGLHDFTSTLGQIFKTYNWEYSDLINKNLTGSLYPYDSITSRFAERVISTGTANGKLFFNAGSLGIIEFTGVYQSTADFSVFVPFRQQVELFIPAIPVIGVSGESDLLGRMPIFCENGSSFTVTGYPLATSSDVTGFFTLRDSVSGATITDPGFVDNGNGTATFSPSSLVLKNSYKTIRVEYTYKQNNSPAVGTGSLYIRVTPNPKAEFSKTSVLLSDSIPGFNATTLNSLSEGRPSSAFSYCEENYISLNNTSKFLDQNGLTIAGYMAKTNPIWTMGDPLNPRNRRDTITDRGVLTLPDSVIFKYANIGTYQVEFTVESQFGCKSNVYTSSITVGEIPKPGFDITGLSTATPIVVTNTTKSSIPPNNSITTNSGWNFGDPYQPDLNKMVFDTDNTNMYPTPGHYTVTLKATTSVGCEISYQRPVIIVPGITSDVENFESNDPLKQWQTSEADTIKSSWVRAKIDTTSLSKNKLKLRSNVWVTGRTDFYNPGEESYLFSPVYGVSSARPMISFDQSSFMAQNDGIVLEFSTDNLNVADPLKKWFRLGQAEEGTNWYNKSGLASKPGTQLEYPELTLTSGDYGWSYRDTLIRSSRHSLSPDLPSSSQGVVFRFVLKSVEERLGDQGFAIDNFRIGERTRTVLIENFANKGTINPAEKTESDYLKSSFPGTVGTDYIKVNYHVGFPGADPFNATNPADPSARALYYNVSKTPTAFLDSYDDPIPLNSINRLFSQWGETVYGSQSLELAGADITITAILLPSNTYSVNVSVTAKKDLPASTILHLGFLEGEISLNSPLIKTSETEFEYVLKKLLPSAAGTRFVTPLVKDQTRTFGPFEWMADPAKLFPDSKDDIAVVAFLQDETTKEVHQSALVPGLKDPAVVTGIEAILPEHVNVYPNPASKEFKVELPAFVQNEVPINLIDLTGRKHEGGAIRAGSNEATVSVENLSEGIYILEIGSGSTGIIRKKIMVVMKN